MNPAAGSRLRWIYAAAGALIILGGVAALFRSPHGGRTVAVPPVLPHPAAVKLVNLKRNEAALTDPTPLFLPTEWNAGQNALPANASREPDSSFTGYPAKLMFEETDLALSFPGDVNAPARPADALSAGRLGPVFLGLGNGTPDPAQLPARKAFVEITIAGNGQRILAQTLTDANPPGWTGWRQPMEFLVAVDAMGLVGPMILTESSRAASVDGYFQNYLVKKLHAGERLGPGFYRIWVGP
jgi:hypothetical protein